MVNSTILERLILLTIIYYDLLNKPLTSFEIWKYLIKPSSLRTLDNFEQMPKCSLFDVIDTLEKSIYLNNLISQRNGFYFLKYRSDDFFHYGIKIQKICAQKIKKIRRYINLIKYLPFVRAIFLSGSVAMGYATERSDLDVLIVAKNRRIWLVRAMTAGVTFLFGIKRMPDELSKYKDKICLNHFITTESLSIPFQSIYTAQIYARLLPLYDEGNYFEKFYKKNQWIKNYLINYEIFMESIEAAFKGNEKIPFFKKIFEMWFGIFDFFFGSLIKRIQTWLIKRNPKTYQSGGRIIFNDQMLEFHPNSKEKDIIENYNKKIIEFNFDKSFCETDSGLIK